MRVVTGTFVFHFYFPGFSLGLDNWQRELVVGQDITTSSLSIPGVIHLSQVTMSTAISGPSVPISPLKQPQNP